MSTATDSARPTDHARVREAAARLVPAHSEYPNPNRAWYALVGTNLYYVRDLLREAFGGTPPDVETCRRRLDELGFPVFALGYGELLTDGHPAHR
ncbi:hypothetical protein [Streptomyces sp. DH12]|uniref:hypothetical protein n=1 Tax=Streptomyces sp. DH12 TaxID=2857010 RepID=UPI001E5E041A|nr:hypothetical protein [Streptomyces sp. DH12]